MISICPHHFFCLIQDPGNPNHCEWVMFRTIPCQTIRFCPITDRTQRSAKCIISGSV